MTLCRLEVFSLLARVIDQEKLTMTKALPICFYILLCITESIIGNLTDIKNCSCFLRTKCCEVMLRVRISVKLEQTTHKIMAQFIYCYLNEFSI